MRLKPNYMKMIMDEIENPLTYAVKITRNFNEDNALVITLSQRMPVELYGTPEMRRESDVNTK